MRIEWPGRFLLASLVLCMAVPAMAAEVEILNVYDAFGSAKGTKQHFGFSAVVRHGDLTILFDAGADADIFASNLKALGVDPKEIDIAVASHNHADHISGFDHLLKVNPNVRLYLPHDFALGAPVKLNLVGTDPTVVADLPPEQVYFGGAFEAFTLATSGRFRGSNVEYVREGKEIAPGIHLVPTQSKLLGTFSRYPPNEDDPSLGPMPELSLSIETADGDLLLVGCSHASVEVIVKETNIAPLDDFNLKINGVSVGTASEMRHVDGIRKSPSLRALVFRGNSDALKGGQNDLVITSERQKPLTVLSLLIKTIKISKDTHE